MSSSGLRILAFCGQLGAGGAPKVALNVTKHLRESVDEVAVCYMGDRDDLVPAFEDLGVNVRRLGDGIADPRPGPSLWRFISQFRPDVLHTHMISAAGLGRLVGSLRGLPVVSTIHTSYGNRSAPIQAVDLATSPFAAVNVSVSNAVAASLPPYFGLGARSVVVHNCIDPADIRERGNVRWKNLVWNEGLSPDQPLIANVTRFDPKKRKVDLIRALPSILEEFPDAALVLTGWGEHRTHVEDVARAVGVGDRTKFVGTVPNPYSVYRHADVVAFPSVSEGFSIGLLEAMAFGTPIVATDIPPFREALGADYPLVPTRDPSAICDATRRYLREPDEARRAGERLATRVEHQFSGRSAAASYLELYKSLVDHGS